MSTLSCILGQEPASTQTPVDVDQDEFGGVLLDNDPLAFNDADDRDDDFVEADCIGHDLDQEDEETPSSSYSGATVASLNSIPTGIDQAEFCERSRSISIAALTL